MIQKRNRILGLLALTAFVLGMFGGLAVRPAYARMVLDEFPVSNTAASQEFPDISGFNVVWQDNRNGNWDIYLYNAMGQYAPDTRITSNSANQMHPSISGSVIVYEDDRNGNLDIYMYNLTSQAETRITTNTATQKLPQTDYNRIVWQDNRNGNWDIYVYDLNTRVERRLTSTGSNEDPAISFNLVIYEKWITQNNIQRQAVFYVDVTNGTEIQLSSTGDSNYNPAIFNSRVVWESSRTFELSSQDEVVLRDVYYPLSWETVHPSDQENPDINEYYIVYQDDRSWTADYLKGTITYTSDIYLYNYDTQSEVQITSNPKNQINPAVNGGRIVYQDDRNGNWDIYMTMVGYVPDSSVPMVMATPPQAAGPSGDASPTVEPTQSGISENQAIIPAEFQMPLFVAMAAAIILLAVLTAFFWRRGKAAPAKGNPKGGD